MSFQEFHKVQYLGPCYLTSFYVTYYLKMKIIILQITLMTPPHTLLVKIQQKYYKIYLVLLKNTLAHVNFAEFLRTAFLQNTFGRLFVVCVA